MNDAADEAREYQADIRERDRARLTAVAELKRALEAFGGSATALAKAAGVSPSTITRPIKDPRTSSLPKWATIVKILEAAGLKPQSYGGPTTAPNNLQLIEIIGELRPGVWFEDVDGRDYGPSLVLSLEPLRSAGSLSAFVVGPEGIPYPPGTKAIVDNARAPQAGDTVVYRRVQGDLIETFAVLYQHENARHVLYKTAVDGQTHRYQSAPLAKDLPDIGVRIGPVIATLWIKA